MASPERHAPVKREVQEPPPLARKVSRRTITATTPPSVVKAELDEDLPGLVLKGDVDCLGCFRCSRDGKSFLNPEEPVEIVYQSSRGGWCKECHTVWRTLKRGIMSLTLYEMHLDGSSDNRTEHFQFVCVYVMMRFEGVGKITKDSIIGRTESMRVLFKMMGIPFGPFIVCPRPVGASTPDFSPLTLCSSLDSEGQPSSLMCLCPMALSMRSEKICARPSDPQQQSVFPIMVAPAEADRSWLRELSGEPAGEEGQVTDAPTASAVSVVPTRASTPGGECSFLEASAHRDVPKSEIHVWKKASGVFISTKTCLGHVLKGDPGEDEWLRDATKILKAHLLKLNRVRNDLMKCPFSKYINALDAMIKAVLSCTNFAKEAGVYVKKYTNIDDIHPVSSDMWEWVSKHKACGVSVPLSLLHIKALAQNMFLSQETFGAGVERVSGKETAKLLAGRSVGEQVDLLLSILANGVRGMCSSYGEHPDARSACAEVLSHVDALVLFVERLTRSVNIGSPQVDSPQ